MSPTLELAVVARDSPVITDVVTGASTTRTSVRDAVTITVSPKLASDSVIEGTSTASSPTMMSSTVSDPFTNPALTALVNCAPGATASAHARP